MSKTVSFINEQVIYFYLDYRFQKKSLFLIPKIVKGKLFDFQKRKVQVKRLQQISGTKFPDFNNIILGTEKIARPAEVKFITSKFDYHSNSKYKKEYEKFRKNNGFIIVVKHDSLPKGLTLKSGVDVYEIDYQDFIEYCRDNFSILIFRQIDMHLEKNIWLMYASDNYYKQKGNIQPAVITKRWAPSQNLGNLEIGIGDIILLFRCKGINRIESQKFYLINKHPHPKVYIDNLNILKVTSYIYSREEYCKKNHLDIDNALWPDEIERGTRWKRIFEFNIIKSVKEPIFLSKLYKYSEIGKYISCYFSEVFQVPSIARKISSEQYTELLHFLI